jgi:nucleotide-binding universal stress UspA family protein
VGAPAPAIVGRSAHADLAVVGTRAASGLGRLLLGSVATEVVRDAPCSVLLVPPAAVSDLVVQQRRDEAEAEWHRHFG